MHIHPGKVTFGLWCILQGQTHKFKGTNLALESVKKFKKISGVYLLDMLKLLVLVCVAAAEIYVSSL